MFFGPLTYQLSHAATGQGILSGWCRSRSAEHPNGWLVSWCLSWKTPTSYFCNYGPSTLLTSKVKTSYIISSRISFPFKTKTPVAQFGGFRAINKLLPNNPIHCLNASARSFLRCRARRCLWPRWHSRHVATPTVVHSFPALHCRWWHPASPRNPKKLLEV